MNHAESRPAPATERAAAPAIGPMAHEAAAALRALYLVSSDGLVIEHRVEVALRGGVATLCGTVDSDGQRRAAEAYLRQFDPGVAVSNQILVRA